jgi:hypothetical protein
MLFFRSEVDLDAWLKAKDCTHGATLTVSQLWQLSQHWYHNRLEVEFHGRTLEQIGVIFKEVGLVSEFWQ